MILEAACGCFWLRKRTDAVKEMAEEKIAP